MLVTTVILLLLNFCFGRHINNQYGLVEIEHNDYGKLEDLSSHFIYDIELIPDTISNEASKSFKNLPDKYFQEIIDEDYSYKPNENEKDYYDEYKLNEDEYGLHDDEHDLSEDDYGNDDDDNDNDDDEYNDYDYIGKHDRKPFGKYEEYHLDELEIHHEPEDLHSYYDNHRNIIDMPYEIKHEHDEDTHENHYHDNKHQKRNYNEYQPKNVLHQLIQMNINHRLFSKSNDRMHHPYEIIKPSIRQDHDNYRNNKINHNYKEIYLKNGFPKPIFIFGPLTLKIHEMRYKL